jgi:hypothetical protein
MRKPHPTDIDRKYGLDLQYVVQFGVDQDVAPVMADCRALAEVELVCPNGVMRSCEAPNDPLYSSQWHWQNLNAALAWGIAKGDASVLTLVLDDGIDLDHPDVKANLWINSPEDINGNGVFDTLWYPDGDLDGNDQDGNGYYDDVVGYDFVGGDPIPQPEGGDSHGTHTWGIANAVTNNGEGLAGTAWNNRSFGVRCGSGGGLNISACIQAINYGMNQNVWCVSMSFGSTSPYQPMANACQAAWDYGAVLFGSAGNDGQRVQRYPGCYNGVENVASSGTADKHSSFTNYGPWVDITAPGEGIYSTVPRPASYGTMDGTSMSCPLAAGVASWVKSWDPALSNQAVLDIMHDACDTMPDSLFRIGELGAGRVSLGNIVLTRYFCDLKLQTWRFNDASGNNNGRPDPGETVSLIVTYYNTLGFQNATSVSATLACSDTNVQITKGTAGFPDIPAGGNGNCSADSFVITVPASIPPQYLTFKVLTHATPEPAYPLTYFQVKCGEPRLLIVDDDEGSDFEKYYTAACDSNYVLYDKYTVQTSGSPSSDTLRHYPVVAWFTGNATTNTLTATDRTNLTSYLDNGGNLFIAGQNIAQELTADPFLGDYLHATFVDDSIGKIYMIGVPGDPITSSTGADTMTLGGAGGANNSKSADGIRPAEGGIGCATYKDYADTTVKSIVRYAGTYKVVFFSCAFEAIDHATSRYLQKWTLMKRILGWFGEGIPPAIAQQLREPEVKPYALKVSPNPFSHQALVEFTAPVSGRMELRTFSTDGRLVASETRTAVIGQHMSFKLDGAKLANGTYLVQVKTPAGVYAQKTAVLK